MRGIFSMSITYNNTPDYKSQVKKFLTKCSEKRSMNRYVIDWLMERKELEYAYAVEDCASYVGFVDIKGVAKVATANFCRRRLCNICVWRRQSKFVAQTFPVIQALRESGFRFIFATASLPNVPLGKLSATIDQMMKAYDLLLKRRKIKRAWLGKIRALEVTYNRERNDFHPHIHMLVAVRPEYFTNPDLYITLDEFREMWTDSLREEFHSILDCKLQSVTDDGGEVIETVKYSFKGTKDSNAIEGYFTALKGRRLISFSGVIAKQRKYFKMTDFENILTDDFEKPADSKLTYQLYKFDATGGVYTFWKEYDVNV
jgi:plasmid rolling circle replication initiator protein Rep